MKQSQVFSPYEIAYLQACFFSGKHSIIQDGLKYISQQVLKEYVQQLQSVLKILNPLTIIMVGVLVILLALVGVLPMIQLTQAVGTKS